jgi:hypothetical protein
MPPTSPLYEERSAVATVAATPDVSRDGASIPQYRLPMILFMLVWPVLWWLFLFHVVVPLFLLDGSGEISTWAVLSISSLGYLAELVGALVVLRSEGCRLTVRALKQRINWRWERAEWQQ